MSKFTFLCSNGNLYVQYMDVLSNEENSDSLSKW